MIKYIIPVILLTTAFAAACANGGSSVASRPVQGKEIISAPIGQGLKVTISNETGRLKTGQQEIMLVFTDDAGKAVDVGTVTAAGLNFRMGAMGSMAPMNNSASFTTTSVPGVYKGTVKIDMAGEWQAQISYEGPSGSGKTSIPVTVY